MQPVREHVSAAPWNSSIRPSTSYFQVCMFYGNGNRSRSRMRIASRGGDPCRASSSPAVAAVNNRFLALFAACGGGAGRKAPSRFDRLHRLDLLPPNFIKADNNFRHSSAKNGEQVIISKKKRKQRQQRPLSTEFTETHYFRKQLPSSSVANGKSGGGTRPISWALPKVNFTRMLNGAEIMTVDEQNHRRQALTTTCSRVTTDL